MKVRVIVDFPAECFYWKIQFLKTKTFLQGITAKKKRNHPRMPTKQDVLTTHLVDYAALTQLVVPVALPCALKNPCVLPQE